MDLLILLGCFHFCWFEFMSSRDCMNNKVRSVSPTSLKSCMSIIG